MVEVKRYFLAAVFVLLGALTAAAQSRTLVHGSRFERDLSPELLDELQQAQKNEPNIPLLVDAIRENHAQMHALAGDYDRAETQAVADSIKAQFNWLAHANANLDQRIAVEGGAIFDSKSYVYNYLMDKNNRNDMLARFEGAMDELRTSQAQWRGIYASDTVVDYLLQKRLMTDYEIALAGETGNEAVRDSLRRVMSALLHPEGLAGLEPIVLTEREFIDTESKERIYRLELLGAGELSAEVKKIIGNNVVRGEEGFVITPLDGATAVRLRAALQGREGLGFEIKIAKISE